MAKKRRKKKKELTIEEQLALMNPEEIYEKALKNITVAKVLEDIDLKVVSYNKAMYFLLYIVDKFDDQTLLYDQEVTKDGRTLSEEKGQLLAVEEAQRLHDQIEIDMESECVKLIALYFKQACEDYEAAKTIDDVRIVRGSSRSDQRLYEKICFSCRSITGGTKKRMENLQKSRGIIKEL